MALDPLKRSRQRQGPSLAFHTIGVQGYFGSVQPPVSEIPGSAPDTCFDTFLFRTNTLNLYTLATFLQIRLVAVVQKPQAFSLANKRLWLTLSNALLRSTATTARQPSFIFKLIKAVEQE